jgi:formate dehydrogenase
MAKIVCVLFPDSVGGHPHSYARDGIPKILSYPGGQTAPTPHAVDFTAGELLGDVSGALGLRRFVEAAGHNFVVTSEKDAPDSVFDRELADADVVISQPFWPAYLTRERIARAPKLKLAITAGVGSDHVDLAAAAERDVTVAEVTFSNSISVAEHAVMMILSMVRDYIPQHDIARRGGWDIADCVESSYDLEGMQVGIVAAGRIGQAVLRRLKPFDVGLHYFSRHQLPEQTEAALGLTYHSTALGLGQACDVLSLHCPLTPATEQMIDADFLRQMRRGAYLVNTARAKLVDRDAVVAALQSGHLAGYAGDVWYPQPAPANHPWRQMPHNGMTPHTSGASLSAQARYAAGTREILECFFEERPIRDEYLIVEGGRLVGTGAKSYAIR